MRPKQIVIPAAIADQLSLAEWNTHTDEQRLAIASEVVDRLELWDFEAPQTVDRFGPSGDEQAIVRIRDRNTGLWFALIPGGDFQRGYSEELLEIYDKIFLSLQSGDFEEPLPNRAPRQVNVIESGRSDLELQPSRPMPPMLMAVTPLHTHTRGLECFGIQEKDEADECTAIDLKWEETAQVMRKMNWGLPTGAEFEWALRGGIDSLFFWGNAVPAWIVEEQSGEGNGFQVTDDISFDDLMDEQIYAEDFSRWPRCNRFGLVNMLCESSWCRMTADPFFPFVARGGAHGWFPWQYCREWMLFMNAIEVRQKTSGDIFLESIRQDRTVRPVIRLVSDEKSVSISIPTEDGRSRFLDAIAKDMENDTLRLEYADWLEQQGDHPRAKLIRKQCELAVPANYGSEETESELAELLEQNQTQWFAELAAYFPDATGTFHRGLLEEIVLDDGVTDEDLENITRFPFIRKLTIQSLGVSDAGLKTLAELPNLLELRLVNTSVTKEGIDSLATNHTNLAAFKSSSHNGELKPAAILFGENRALAYSDFSADDQRDFSLRFLRTVFEDGLSFNAAGTDTSGEINGFNLGHSEISDRSLRYLTPFSNLEILQLGRTQVSSEGLGTLSNLSKLQVLRLQYTEVTDCSFVLNHPNIERLELGGGETQLTDKDVRAIGKLEQLKDLTITTSAITNKSFKWIGKLTRLECLVVQGDFTDKAVAAVAKLPELKELVMVAPGITNQSFKHLRDHPTLEMLTITIDSPDELQALDKIPNLRYLRFFKVSGITWEDLEQWANRNKDVRVEATIDGDYRSLNASD